MNTSRTLTGIFAVMATGCAVHHTRPITAAYLVHSGDCLKTDQICIQADQMPPDATRAMFGPLPREYGSAVVRVCSQLPDAMTMPRAYAESQYAQRSRVTVIPTLVALSVIAHAQASTKTAKTLTGLITAAEIAAAATQLSSVGASVKGVLTETSLGGASLYNILKGATTSGSMLQYSSVTLPDTLQFQPYGCASGIVLDYMVGGSVGGSVSFGVSFPVK